MRFMIIVPATADSEQGSTGTQQQFADMQSYNEEMLRAGVFVDGQGLHPTAKGARVTWEDGDWVVTDGPFAETKELIAGFTIIDVSSREEALEWLKKWPVSCVPDPARRSSCARSTRPRTSATSSRPSCASARSRCAPRPPATRPGAEWTPAWPSPSPRA